METGVLGLQLPPAVSLVEREHKTAPDFAAIQHHPMEEQIAPGKAQKMLLAQHCHVLSAQVSTHNILYRKIQ